MPSLFIDAASKGGQQGRLAASSAAVLPLQRVQLLPRGLQLLPALSPRTLASASGGEAGRAEVGYATLRVDTGSTEASCDSSCSLSASPVFAGVLAGVLARPASSSGVFIITTTIALVTADIIIALVTAIVSAASASHRAS